MAGKKQGIQWTQKQKALLAKTVKDFNRKVTREYKKAKAKGSTAEATNYLPSYIRQSDLKKYIRTAKDLKNITAMYQRFSRAGAADKINGQDATKWEYQEARRLQKRRNKEVEAVRERFDVKKGNTARARDEGYAYTNTDVSKKDRRQLERYIDTQLSHLTDAGKYAKDVQYKENFIAAAEDIAGLKGAQKKYIVGVLNALTPETLRDLWYASDTIHIGFLYPTPGSEQSQGTDFILEIQKFINDKERKKEKIFTDRFEIFRKRSFFTKNKNSLSQILMRYKG